MESTVSLPVAGQKIKNKKVIVENFHIFNVAEEEEQEVDGLRERIMRRVTEMFRLSAFPSRGSTHQSE